MNQPYRLAYLVSHPIQYQAPLLRYIASREDIDLTVFFLSDFSTREYDDPGFGMRIRWDVPLREGYDSVVLPAWGKNDKVSFWVPWTYGIWKHLKAGNFHAIWIHGYNSFSILRAIVFAKMLGLKIFLRGDSHLHSHPRTKTKIWGKSWILPRIFSWIDGFLAVGTLNRDFYMHYGVPSDRIFLMPNAVDNSYFQQEAHDAKNRVDSLREHLHLDPFRPVILTASKIQGLKRSSDLLEAYIQLSSDGVKEPHPYLIFIGDGQERSNLEARVRKLRWASVKFLGFKNQSDLPSYYALCDVFVLCSEFETWGLVINEVMNAGKPVIVSDRVGSGPDLVVDGENGFVVPVGHIPLLSTRLSQLTSDSELAEKMGKEGLKRIISWNFESDYRGLVGALAQTLC